MKTCFVANLPSYQEKTLNCKNRLSSITSAICLKKSVSFFLHQSLLLGSTLQKVIAWLHQSWVAP